MKFTDKLDQKLFVSILKFENGSCGINIRKYLMTKRMSSLGEQPQTWVIHNEHGDGF